MIVTHYWNKMLYNKNIFQYKVYRFVDVFKYTLKPIQSLIMQITMLSMIHVLETM